MPAVEVAGSATSPCRCEMSSLSTSGCASSVGARQLRPSASATSPPSASCAIPTAHCLRCPSEHHSPGPCPTTTRWLVCFGPCGRRVLRNERCALSFYVCAVAVVNDGDGGTGDGPVGRCGGRWRAEVVFSWRCRRPSGGGGVQAEHGEAGEVVCGGEEVEIGVDLASAADSRSSCAVLASHQVAELAFDFGAGGPVVGGPVRVVLLGAGLGETQFVATDADAAPSGGVGAVGSQRTVGAGVSEGGDAVAVAVAADRDGDTGRAGDGVGVEVDGEAILGEQPARRGGRLGLAARVDAVFGEVIQELAGAVGGVAVDSATIGSSGAAGLLAATLKLGPASSPPSLRPPGASSRRCPLLAAFRSPTLATATTATPTRRVRRGLLAVVGDRATGGVAGEILDELVGDAGVAGVARRDLGAGDDLAVRIQADVAFVAIEAARRSLVAVTGLRVDGGDHPVLGHPPGDPQGAVVALLQVLADHGGQQLRRLAQFGAQLTALQHHQTRQRVAGPGVDQRLTGIGIVPVDLRLGCGGVVVTATQHGTQLGFQRLVGDAQQTP